VRQRAAGVSALLVTGGALAALSPLAASADDDFFGSEFEAFTGIPAAAAESLSDGQLDELRGGFLGFYFSVDFSGFAELDGSISARLDVNAGLGDQVRGISVDTDDAGSSGPPGGHGHRPPRGYDRGPSRGRGPHDLPHGNANGNLVVEARPAATGQALGPAVTMKDSATGEAFRVQAKIGEAFAGAQGVFQITQVPGNLNNIGQNLVINLVVLQAPEGEAGNLREQLGPLFGF
jgi:hypothetical protein